MLQMGMAGKATQLLAGRYGRYGQGGSYSCSRLSPSLSLLLCLKAALHPEVRGRLHCVTLHCRCMIAC